MTKQKSIVEQALLQVQNLEEAVKQNAKGILASTMKEELNSLLKEQKEDEDELDPEKEVEDVPTETGDEETSITNDEDSDEEGDETSTEDSLTEPTIGGDESGETDNMDDEELPDDEGGEDEMLDMTGASPEEVAKVFRAMKPEDGIVVKKEGDNISLNVEEPGEYLIKLDELDEQMEETDSTITDENIYEIELDDEMTDEESVPAEVGEGKNDPYSKGVGCPLTKGRTEKGLTNSNPEGKSGKPTTAEGNPFDKNEGENLTKKRTEKGLSNSNPAGKSGKPATAEGDPFDKKKGEPVTSGNSIRKTVVKGEQTEAARTKLNPHGDKNEDQSRLGIKGKKIYKAGSSSLNEQVETLKKQNAEYKKALVLFKDKLNEVAVFNANLAYATRLFTEHTTTKQEKMDILKRFDSISTITEAKALYGTIKNELGTKKPVTESVAEKIASPEIKTKSSTEMLSENTVYENPEFKRIKDLMKYKG